jgi:hypothetical protein
MRWAGHVARMGEKRNAYRLLMGKPEGKRQLGRPRRRWEDNIRMNLGRGRMGMMWTGLVWLRIGTGGELLWYSVLSLRVPWNAGKLSSGCTTGGLSSSAQLHGVIIGLCFLLRVILNYKYIFFRNNWQSIFIMYSLYSRHVSALIIGHHQVNPQNIKKEVLFVV